MYPATSALWNPQAHMPTVLGNQINIISGAGVYVERDTGECYLDATAGLWFANVGYTQPTLIEAANRQMRKLETYHQFGEFTSEVAANFANRVAALSPLDDPRMIFNSGGSDAVEVACKLVRRYWQLMGQTSKTYFISREREYHGLHSDLPIRRARTPPGSAGGLLRVFFAGHPELPVQQQSLLDGPAIGFPAPDGVRADADPRLWWLRHVGQRDRRFRLHRLVDDIVRPVRREPGQRGARGSHRLVGGTAHGPGHRPGQRSRRDATENQRFHRHAGGRHRRGGLTLIVSGGLEVSGLPSLYKNTIGGGDLLGIPWLVVLTIPVVIVLYFVLHNTTFGVHLYSVGDNPVAGIKVTRTTVIAYVIAGMLVAYASWLLTARVGSGQPGMGGSYTLQSITAAVIGRCVAAGRSGHDHRHGARSGVHPDADQRHELDAAEHQHAGDRDRHRTVGGRPDRPLAGEHPRAVHRPAPTGPLTAGLG